MNADAITLEVRRQRLDGLLKALHLVRDPFPVTPDYESYFFSPRLQVRYDELLSAVAWRKGFVLVTGDVGVGKTTLARLLIQAMQGEGVRSALVINTFAQGAELLRVINRDFGLEGSAETIEGLIDELHGFLLEQFAAGSNCVLVIDDAQALTVDSLELLRQLSNLETTRHKLLQLVLVGQPELLDLLGRGDLRQLRSRIAMHLRIDPMTLEEMDAYIYHRLSTAGNGAALKVDADALKMLWEATAGYPRRVHLVMDRCLFGVLGRHLTRINRELMREAIAEVELPPGPSRLPTARASSDRRVRVRDRVGLLVMSALFVLAGLVAVVRLDLIPRAALEPLLDGGQVYIDRLSAMLAPPLAAGSALEVTPEEAVHVIAAGPEAQPSGAAVETVPIEAGGAGGALPAAAAVAAVQPAHTGQGSPFASVPGQLWQSYWSRYGSEERWATMPSVSSLPDDSRAALEVLDGALEGTGLRTFLLESGTPVCDEHVALRIVAQPGGAEQVFTLAPAPHSPGLIEFGRLSETVRWAQERLRSRGVLRQEHVDALLGPVTVSALAHFQRDMGLPATGQLDNATLYRLSCGAPRIGRAPAQVAERAP